MTTQQQRIHHEQYNEQDNQQNIKSLLSSLVYDKMRKMGCMVSVEEIEEYC